MKLLDVGGRKTYWNIVPPGLLKEKRVKITILNLPIEAGGQDDEIFKHVSGDACNLAEYENSSFDIAHSNSVIEHVGNWKQMKRFAAETRRVAPGLFV